MKLITVKCQNCGATLKIASNSKIVTCQYCNTDYIVNDEVEKVQVSTAEQAGYELENGRCRAKMETEKPFPQTVFANKPVVIENHSEESVSGCLIIVIILMIMWLSLCTYCGFSG